MPKFKIKITKEEGGNSTEMIPINPSQLDKSFYSSEILSMEVEEINLQRIITAIIGSRKRKSKA